MNDGFYVFDPDNIFTSDHEEIKSWTEKHNGSPAVFDDPNAWGDKLGIRIDFPGKMDERFMSADVKSRPVSWDKFFEIFDKRNLTFVYNTKEEPNDPTMAYMIVPKNITNK
jgi:hypothetical protein